MYSTNLMRWRGIVPVVVALIGVSPGNVEAQWPQWGGPNRNFTVETSGLADSWPEDGPKRLWRRELGDGYSSIVADNSVLYTMYRKGRTDADEYTIAFDAGTGETIWEHKQSSPVPTDGQRFPGPNTTPLVSGDRLYTIGRNAVVLCYNKEDGKVLWEHALAAEFGAIIPGWGYSSSPIVYKDTVIVTIGTQQIERHEASGDEGDTGPSSPPSGEARSLIAFDQKTGKVVWKSQDFGFRFSSPIVINFAGQDQLIVLPQAAIVSVDPANGELLWRHPLSEDEGHHVTPVWNGKDLLFCGTHNNGRVLQLTQDSGKTTPKELWANRKIASDLATPVRMGDFAVTTKGGRISLILGVDIATGTRLWVQRGFGTTTLIHGDGKLVLLDDHGQLGIATATREGLTVHSKWQIPEWSNETFATPTLVGQTLYIRDRTRVMALDLGAHTTGREG